MKNLINHSTSVILIVLCILCLPILAIGLVFRIMRHFFILGYSLWDGFLALSNHSSKW